MRYIAGWNMPGYLPEMEPAGFFTWEAAVAFIRDAVDELFDQYHWVGDDVTEGTMDAYREESETCLALIDSIKRDDPGVPFTFTHDVENLTYWVVVNVEATEIPEAEFDERYEPVDFNGHVLLTSLDEVGNVSEDHVWSLIDGDDGNVWLVNARRDDATQFMVTAHPWTSFTYSLIAINDGPYTELSQEVLHHQHNNYVSDQEEE